MYKGPLKWPYWKWKSPLDDKIVTIKSRSYVEIRNFLGSRTYFVEKTNDCTLFYSVLLNSTNFPTHLWCLWRVVSFCVSGWEMWAREMAVPGGGGVAGCKQSPVCARQSSRQARASYLSYRDLRPPSFTAGSAPPLRRHGPAMSCQMEEKRVNIPSVILRSTTEIRIFHRDFHHR